MNLENINHAINIMKRAGVIDSLRMIDWQSQFDEQVGSPKFTEHELHICGNKACFAGHIAVSPEFIEAGGTADRWCGSPCYSGKGGAGAVALWLGISKELADSLVYGDLDDSEDVGYSPFYNCAWGKVTAPMVIEKLELIKSGELQ